MRLDSHQHFWHFDPKAHVWMTPQMDCLRRDFLPDELRPLLREMAFDGSIAVQARQNLEETQWLLQLAQEHDFIKGVVGWLDLRSPALSQQLERFGSHPRLVGVRHVVHDEPDDQFLLGEDFQRGLRQLRPFNLTYDLLLFPRHLPVAVQLLERFPEQPFVLDHIAKPDIKAGSLSPWKKDLAALARFPNVFCKLSGMVTEAPWGRWQPHQFHPYLDSVLEAFGPQRVTIGSDWPVCTLSGSYSSTMRIVLDYVQQLAPALRQAILGDNCARFYSLHTARSHTQPLEPLPGRTQKGSPLSTATP